MVDILRVIFSGLFLSPVLAFGKTFNLRDIPANLAIAPDVHVYRSTISIKIANKYMCLNTVQVHKEFHSPSKLYYKALF